MRPQRPVDNSLKLVAFPRMRHYRYCGLHVPIRPTDALPAILYPPTVHPGRDRSSTHYWLHDIVPIRSSRAHNGKLRETWQVPLAAFCIAPPKPEPRNQGNCQLWNDQSVLDRIKERRYLFRIPNFESGLIVPGGAWIYHDQPRHFRSMHLDRPLCT